MMNELAFVISSQHLLFFAVLELSLHTGLFGGALPLEKSTPPTGDDDEEKEENPCHHCHDDHPNGNFAHVGDLRDIWLRTSDRLPIQNIIMPYRAIKGQVPNP